MKFKVNGFTLIELMTTVSILAIGSTLAAPNIIQHFNNQNHQDISEQVLSQMQEAREHAIKNKTFVNFHFNIDTDHSNTAKDFYLNAEHVMSEKVSKIQFDMLGQVKYNPSFKCVDLVHSQQPDMKLKIEINPRGDFQVINNGSECIV